MCRALLWVDFWVCYTVHGHHNCSVGKLNAANIFQGLIYISWMYTPKQNGSSYILYNTLTLTFPITPMSLFSPLVACTDYLPVQKPVKTSSMLSILTSKIFSCTEPSIPFGWINTNVCCGELGSINLQSSSSKHKAMHFVLTKPFKCSAQSCTGLEL